MQRYILSTAVRRLRVPPRNMAALSVRTYASITYSGGQASEGQGGYYGSGGARALDNATNTASVTSDLLALTADVDNVSTVMKDLQGLETLLEGEPADGISGKNIELRNNIKKLMTAKEFLESLSRLEVKGEPAWGLSESERDMIIFAREKVNSS